MARSSLRRLLMDSEMSLLVVRLSVVDAGAGLFCMRQYVHASMNRLRQ